MLRSCDVFRSIRTRFACGLLGLATVTVLPAQDEAEVNAALRSAAIQAAGEYTLTIGGDPDHVAHLVPEPVVTFIMKRVDGAFIFLWTDQDRPAAIAQIYHRERNEGGGYLWLHQFRSLSEQELELRRGGQTLWHPVSAGIEWKRLGDASPPPAAAPLRRSGMKQLVRRFEATEQMMIGGVLRTYQLDLRPRELYAYTSSDADQEREGALFWFARDDNDPELLIAIEAVTSADDPHWQYAVIPFTSYPVRVQLDDQELLTTPDTRNATSLTEPQHVWSYSE